VLLPRKNAKLPKPKSAPTEDRSLPVWLAATGTFYKKLNRVADACGLTRIEALEQGLDALLQRQRNQDIPLRKVAGTKQVDSFRATMSEVSRNFWATLTPEQKSERARKNAIARWKKKKETDPEATE
jgi:hypothetical protein